MAGYIVTGKPGAGKGKFGVMRMREALEEGRRVATNFNLHLDNLLPAKSRATAVRVPDRPTGDDLLALGSGSQGTYDETMFGELHLDEAASWLNTRQYADKGRAALIDWLVHQRKHRWHVYIYVQELGMIDKQIREGLADYCVKIVNANKMRIPVVGAVLGKKHGRMPRLHLANTSMLDLPGVIVERDWFRGDDLHDGYETEQRFREWARDPKHPMFHSEREMGSYSMLSAWHLKGRQEPTPKISLKPKLPIIAKLAKLPPDEAMRLAASYARFA